MNSAKIGRFQMLKWRLSQKKSNSTITLWCLISVQSLINVQAGLTGWTTPKKINVHAKNVHNKRAGWLFTPMNVNLSNEIKMKYWVLMDPF